MWNMEESGWERRLAQFEMDDDEEEKKQVKQVKVAHEEGKGSRDHRIEEK